MSKQKKQKRSLTAGKTYKPGTSKFFSEKGSNLPDSHQPDWVGKPFDVIHKPVHYNVHPSGIEIIQITKYETFFRGNILKYVFRAPYKGSELEDLEKAREYLDREIEYVKEKQREALWSATGPADALFQTVPQ